MRGDDGEAGFHFIPGSPIIDLYCIVCGGGGGVAVGFHFIGSNIELGYWRTAAPVA